MSSGLTILTPGGVAMASEEVFTLMDQCRLMAAACDRSVWRLRMVSGMASGVRSGIVSLERAKERLEGLATSLHQLATQAAAQEAWRTRTLDTLRDRLLYAAVAGSWWSGAGMGGPWAASMRGNIGPTLTARSQLRGAEPDSAVGDAAAVLAGHEGQLASVSVTEAFPPTSVAPAKSLAERIARIPDTAHPIRVETYRLQGGATHADVFIAGTDDWGVGVGAAAFDLESNLKLVAGHTALSVLATTQALRHAGVKPGDSVTFIGHSQGGAVATTLAESGVYKTAGLITAGSPTGTLPVRGDYPALVIEHTNDIVPSLGGKRVNTNATVVTRDSGHHRLDVVGAHSAESYTRTASLIDQSAAPELTGFHSPVTPVGHGRVVVFSATRQPGPQPPG